MGRLGEIQEKFYEKLSQNLVADKQIELLMFRVIVIGFELFCQESLVQQKWILLSLEKSFYQSAAINYQEDKYLNYDDLYSNEISPFMQLYLKLAFSYNSFNPDYPFQDFTVELVKQSEIPTQVDTSTNFGALYRKTTSATKIQPQSFVEPLGRILIDDLSYLNHQNNSVKLPNSYKFEDLFPQFLVKEYVKCQKENSKLVEQEIEKQSKQKEKPQKAKKSQKKQEEKKQDENKQDQKKQEEKKEKPKYTISQYNKVIHLEHTLEFWKYLYLIGQNSCEKIRGDGIYFWGFISKLFQESWAETSKIQNIKLEYNIRNRLVNNFCNLLDRSLGSLTQNYINLFNSSPSYFQRLTEQLQKVVFIFSSLIFQSSIVKFPKNEELILFLVKILDKMKRLLDIKCQSSGVTQNLLEKLLLQSSEGVDQSLEKIFETPHPYERGKQFIFEQQNFPNAIALSVEFDPLCQSDTTNDYLIIQGWYDTHTMGSNQPSNTKDGIGSYFKVSGKPGIKKPLIILGNTVQVEFYSHSQAKDGHSLNRWGFKISVRPIYGVEDKFKNQMNKSMELNELRKKFGSSNLQNWITSLKIVLLCSLEILENLFDPPTKGSPASIFKWVLIRQGLTSHNLDQYLSIEHTGIIRFVKDRELQFNDFKQKNYEILNQSKLKKEEIQWRVEGSEMLQEYLLQVKEMEGEFVEFAREICRMIPQNNSLRMEKMRQTFKKEYQRVWEQVEVLIVLNVLYHSGLISLKLKEIKEYMGISLGPHIVGQLEGIKVTKNQIIGNMLKEVQEERELQLTILDMEDIHKKSIQKQLEKQIEIEENKKKEELRKKEEKQKEEIKVGVQEAEKTKQETKPKVKLVKDKVVKAKKKIMISSVMKPSKKIAKQEKEVVQKGQEGQEKQKEKVIEKVQEKEEEKKMEESEDELISIGSQQKAQAKQQQIIEATPIVNSQFREIEDELYQKFEERFKGNKEILQPLCSALNIEFQEDNLNETTKSAYQECKKILFESLKSQKPNSTGIEFQSPYLKVGNEMLRKCIFLLSISNHMMDFDQLKNDQKYSEKASINSGEVKLTPIGMNRSISLPLNEKQIDKEKLKVFRSWIESYQQWKSYTKNAEDQNDDVLYKEDCSPLKSIVSFLCLKIDTQFLRIQLELQNSMCQQRIIGMNLLNMWVQIFQLKYQEANIQFYSFLSYLACMGELTDYILYMV